VQEALEQLLLHYGYAMLFGLLAVGIVGIPVPDEILMTFVGYWTSVGTFSYTLSILVSFAGAMTGMIVSYTLGRRVGKPFLWRYGKWIKLTPERLEKAEGWFHKYGLWTVSFGYFVPGVRHFTCYLAGVSAVKFWRYLLYAGTGALLWCTTFITLGHFIGASLLALMPAVHHYVGQCVLLLAIVAGGVLLVVLRKRKRAVQ